MNNWTKFAISLGVFLGLAWLIRSFAFTIYSVPENGLVAGLHSGSRVIVNKVANTAYKKGDVVVFTDSLSNYIGTIKAATFLWGKPAKSSSFWKQQYFQQPILVRFSGIRN